MTVAAVLAVAAPVVTAAHAADPLRVLIVGDSVTQGSTGDWTWRYRLWKQFQASGVPVDFVGPHDGIVDLFAGGVDSHDYLDPAFDQDHAARWGMKLSSMERTIGDLVTTYQPDVVVDMLGVNDLLYGDRTVDGLLRSTQDLVAEARTADPDVDIVLGSIFQQWFAGVAAYNAFLPYVAAGLDSERSRVVATPPDPGSTGDDTWDGSHPAATGEVQIAVGVADALERIGVPVGFDQVPVVENGPPDPGRLTVTRTTRSSVSLTWTKPLGSTSVVLWGRDLTTGEDEWSRQPFPFTGTTWTGLYLEENHHFQYRIQAAKGSAVAERVFSDVVDAWTVPPTPGPAADLALTPIDHGLSASWSPVPDATRYRVRWWSVDQPEDVSLAETIDPGWTVTGLRAGRRYAVSVEPLADWVPGPPTVVSAAAGGTVPAAPLGVVVAVGRNGIARVSWAPTPGATSYVVVLDGGTWPAMLQPRWRSPVLAAGRHTLVVQASTEDLVGPPTTVRFRVPRA